MRYSLKFITIATLIFLTMTTTITLADNPFTVEVNKIADTNTVRPGGFKRFTKFYPPYLQGGNITFMGKYKNNSGIYSTINNVQLNVIVNTKTKIPGSKYFFSDFNQYGQPILLGDSAVFSGCSNNGSDGIFKQNNGTITAIINQNQPIPGNKALGTFNQLQKLGFFNSGHIAFVGIGQNSAGIYYKQNNKINILVDNRTSIPGGKGNFTQFTQTAFDNTTSFAFVAQGDNGQTGIYWADDNGGLHVIANKDTYIPDLNSKDKTTIFSLFRQISYDGNSQHMAFIGEGILGQQGIYYYTGSKLTTAVNQLTQIPNDVGTFKNFYNASIHNDNIAFTADKKNQKGLYIYTIPHWLNDAGLYKILSSRDNLNNKKITDIEIGPHSLQDGKIAVLLSFNDGSNGIYLLKLKKN